MLSFIFSFFATYSQVDEVKLVKSYNEMDYAPQIAGFYDGEIPVDLICDVRGLFTGRGLRIIVFDLEYYNGGEDLKIHVVGNQIPDSVCAVVHSISIDSELYFTNIKAVDLDGSIKHLSPMRLIAMKEED